MLDAGAIAAPARAEPESGAPDAPSRTKGATLLAILLGFVLPAFVYALVITRGTLDLFGPEYGWQAYNAYALALAHGHTDVPIEAIGAEGFFINGRVYMYYGMLPAFLRWLFMPFADLSRAPVSLFMTWAFCTGAAAVLQAAVLRIYWSLARQTWTDKLLLVAASLGVWLGSGPWLVLQNGTFYHEPFAVGLLLSALALYLLVDDALLGLRAPSIKRLCFYALLAGLAVYTRQTMAISLYGVALAVAAAPILIEGWSRASTVRAVQRLVLPCLILGAFGIVYVWSNVARFGGDAFPMRSYGFYILFGSLSSTPQFADEFHRLQSIEAVGQFHLSRIIPNLIYYLIGGDELRAMLIDRMGGGYTMAFGRSVRLVVGWAVPLLLGLIGAWYALSRPGRLYRLALIAAFALGGAMQLAYATAAYRYASELWPLVAVLMCFGLAASFRNAKQARAKAALATGIALAAVVMTGYSLKLSAPLKYDYPDAEGSLLKPMPPQLTRLVRN